MRSKADLRGLCCRPVSVHPFVTLVYCIHTAEDIVHSSNFFLSPVARFWTPSADTPNFKGNPSAGSKVHGVGKFFDFRLKSPFISETVRDRPLVVMAR